jgi:type I restriction enzyme, S subunit
MHYSIQTDRETSERAGASGMFQVVSITDDNDNDTDVTGLVGQGRHFSTIGDVVHEIARQTREHPNSIMIDVV